MKKKTRLLSVALSAVLFSSVITPFAEEIYTTDKKEIELELSTEYNKSAPVLMHDAKEEQEILELAPIDPAFFDKESGLKASPLMLNEESVRVGVRSALPPRFDLREEKRVTPVRSQGKNGSCWAFATYGSMESYLKHYGEYDFSEKHMRNTHGFDWGIDDGGNREIAAAYLARGDGPVSEGADPYDPRNSSSPEHLPRMLDMDKIIYLPNMSSPLDQNAIKQAIMKYGGVYTIISSAKFYENTKYNSFYNPGAGRADHAVTIVGWDDNFSKNAFIGKPAGNGAWICKNSWGKNYMDRGYYYVSYYDAHAGKSNAVFVPKALDKEAKIYQYDPLGATRSVGYAGKGFMANVFSSERNEHLKEIGLFNVSANTKYTLYVANDIKKTSELGEKKRIVAEGVFEYPGYYTIPVKNVELKEGEGFGIIAELDSTAAGYRFPLSIESKIEGFSSKVEAKEGQSYVSSNGDHWTDLTTQVKDANVCLKAITTTNDSYDPNIVPPKPITPDEPDPTLPDGTKRITDIRFAEGNQGYLDVLKKGQLTALIGPADSKEKVIFSSSKPNICVVDKDKGIVYPRDPGNCNIIARSESGAVSAVFNIQIVPVGLKATGREEVPVIGPNDYVPPEDEKDPTPGVPDPTGPSIRPGEDTVAPNDGVARKIFFVLNKKTIFEGESLDLNTLINVYPATAKKEVKFKNSDEGIAHLDESGVLKALTPGELTIEATTSKGLKATIEIKITKDPKVGEVNIIKVENSKRKAGIFRIYFEATKGDLPYNGPAHVKVIGLKRGVTKKDRVLERNIYFTNGKASVKFLGGDFWVWLKDFKGELKVEDKVKNFEFRY